MKATRCIAIFLVVATPHLAMAKVAGTTLGDLAKISPTIVLAKVERTSKIDGRNWAEARVLEVIKGPALTTLHFLAEPTWTCDISEAKDGEKVLLFLQPAATAEWMFKKRPEHLPNESFLIAWSGRGRMPLREISGERYATLWSDVRLPESVRTHSGPEPKYSFIRSARLSDILVVIRRAPNSTLQRTSARRLLLLPSRPGAGRSR